MENTLAEATETLVIEVNPEASDTDIDDSKNCKTKLAFEIFNSSIKRAENLLNIDIAENGKKLNISNDKLVDCYRAVVVLSISALDAYVKTFIINEIKVRLNSKTLSTDLKKYVKEELFNKETLYNHVLEANFIETVMTKFDDDFEKKSFQGQKVIDKYMKLAGYDQIFKSISKSADKSVDNLMNKIDLYTQRRHAIVHSGDHDLNQTTIKENKISKEDASDCISLVKLIACEIDKISQNK